MIALLAAIPVTAPAQGTAQPKPPAPGEARPAKTRTPEAGTKGLQAKAPLKPFDVYMVGFHPMKDHPEVQIEAHHFCHQINEDFAQCILFDGNTRDANLSGIEYIVSEKLFATLPEEEQKYWHPHNGEILSGQLAAPGMPLAAEKALMRSKMNSYGKTWHVWNTGAEGISPDKLPLGPAMLAWSFNRDGEATPALIEKRDKRMGIDSAEKRRQRADLQTMAKPQSGVDDMKGKFGGDTQDIPGVIDKTATPESSTDPAK